MHLVENLFGCWKSSIVNKPNPIRLLPPILILGISFAIYFRVLFYSGFIQWGNFGFPLKFNLFYSLSSITWNPYSYNGIPVTTPWISLFSDLNTFLVIMLGGYWNISASEKLYLVFCIFFMSFAFYILSWRFSPKFFSKMLATVFLMLNPLTLQMVGEGDSFQFLFLGIYFISLALLSKAIGSKGIQRPTYWIISVIFLSWTVAFPQLFYLGLPLYLIFTFYFSVLEKKQFNFSAILTFFKTCVITVVLIILLSAPLILTTFFGAYNLSPSSSSVRGLNNFALYSSSFFNLLLMNSQMSYSITALLEPLKSAFMINIWLAAIFLLTLLILESGIIFRDLRLLFLTGIVIVASLLGSGYLSPISEFTIYLYEHLYGYQLLNASYYWEWIIIIPVYGLLISVLSDRLSEIRRRGPQSETRNEHRNSAYLESRRVLSKRNGIVKTLVALLIILVLVPPAIAQGYYGTENSGVHDNNLPSSYNYLAQQLSQLVGDTGVGVAYFNPYSYVYFGDSNNGLTNPLLISPSVRSPGMLGYGTPPVISSYFAYWAYTEFYLNETKNIAEIMSLLGVKYFVTLNGVNAVSYLPVSYGVNATKLMEYQKNIRMIYSSPSYSIFESTLNVDMANRVNSFTLMSGNYETLTLSSSLGIDLTRLVPVFLGDLNSSNFNFFINNASSIVFLNSQGLTSLAIDRFVNESDSINLLNYAGSNYYSLGQGWSNSRTFETTDSASIVNDAYPFVITDTNKSMKINIDGLGKGNYTIWAYVMDSPVANSKLQFTMNNNSTEVNTSVSSENLGNFSWVQVQAYVSTQNNVLKINSIQGENGIERLVILRNGEVEREEKYLDKMINSRGIIAIDISSKSRLFQHNGSLSGAVEQINRNLGSTSPLYIVNNPNGYEVYGNLTNISLIRYGFFSEIKETNPEFKVLPIMGGLSFVLVSTGTHFRTAFVSVYYYLLVVGTIIYLGTVSALAAWLMFKKYYTHRRKGKGLIKTLLRRHATVSHRQQ